MVNKNAQSENVLKNLEQLILPTLKSIRRRSTPVQKQQVDVLVKNILQITSDFGKNISSEQWQLSSSEIEVCNLIREEISTLEIADILCTSKRTIDNHRNRIRKKLGISNTQRSLNEYLKSLE